MTTRMTRMMGVLVGALGAMLVIGCDDAPPEVPLENVESELVDQWCETMFACDCPEGRAYSDVQQCGDAAALIASGLQMYAGTMGYQYDPACVGEFVARVDDCDPPGKAADECVRPCNVLFGMRGLGEPCESIGTGLSTCRQGLQCSGVCQDPCGYEGAALGQRCEEVGCEEGLYCKWDELGFEARCAAPPALGAPCPDNVCEGDAFCALPDPMGIANVCIAPRDNGEPCMGHSQCESRHCPMGYCAELPGRGDDCPAQVCDTGLTCREGVCEVAAAQACWMDLPWYWYGPIDG